MKILLSWLREFVDAPGTAEEIAATMSVRGFAVEGIEPISDGDAVLDFEITANRPDCMSVMGIAREVATAFGLQVRRPAVRGIEAGQPAALALASLRSVDSGDVDIVIDDPHLCARYAGALADVTVGPSPDWMQARLRAAGVRPISNIVDITNYVLLELGQPMHAFDAARIGGNQIRVRAARDGERITTLDGHDRGLTRDMLVIADAERPIAVAGVMGGADSEVADGTRTIVLESAYFNPSSVRRTSRQLGLKTEASIRFERGGDPRLPVTAMERACALLEITGAGTPQGTVVDRYPRKAEPVSLRLRRDRIAGLLGTAVPDGDVRRILEGLGFALRDAEDGWTITVPTRRVDVAREVDLIEEVARHYGFDRIPMTFPPLRSAPPPPDPRLARARQLRGVMTGAGFSETVTFGFISHAAGAVFARTDDIVSIANPLAETFGVLRPSLLPGLVAAVGHNRRREQPDVRLFEIGGRFTAASGEGQAIACAWLGAAIPPHWSGSPRGVDLFDMKGLVARVCDVLRVDADAPPAAHDVRWLVPGRSAAVVSGGRTVGWFGQLTPAIAEPSGVPLNEPIYVAELDLDALALLASAPDRQVEPLPRYPSVTRDISVLVDDTLAAALIRQAVRDAAPPTLVSVREFDRYQGKGIPEQKVSVSLRLTFRSPDRTLTDAEVQSAMDAVLRSLTERHGAVQR